jgi:uracil phosphoribosyltransferase
MSRDCQHQSLNFIPSEITHHYGKNVHILSSPLMLSLLAQLGSPKTSQPEINHLLEMMYGHLFDYVVDLFFPRKKVMIETRMKLSHSEAVYEGEAINNDTLCVTVDLARAGTFPSHLCYQKLNYFMNPDRVRQDHFYVARTCDAEGRVTGVNVSGSKIGGRVDESIVLFPDPMGATGGTIVEVTNHYRTKVGGTPQLMIAIHLIVTPEYLKKVRQNCPDLIVVALRLDRGLSPKDVLSEEPGRFWDLEKGLNDHQYIVPGAGGLGEILNNAYC